MAYFVIKDSLIKNKINQLEFSVHLSCCYATAFTGASGRMCVFVNKDTTRYLKCFRFQNEYNKVEIPLRVVQFRSGAGCSKPV